MCLGCLPFGKIFFSRVLGFKALNACVVVAVQQMQEEVCPYESVFDPAAETKSYAFTQCACLGRPRARTHLPLCSDTL